MGRKGKSPHDPAAREVAALWLFQLGAVDTVRPTCAKESPRNRILTLIYKIVPRSLWTMATAQGSFAGAPVDLADGYIHFSTLETVQETADKHFHGQDDLLLVAFYDAALGPALRYEASRGGQLFPHLYAPLPCATALWVKPMPMAANGTHDLSELLS